MESNSLAGSNATSLATVDELINNIVSKRQHLTSVESSARVDIIDNARKLIAALETPFETMMWMLWAEPTRIFATRTAVDLGIFETLIADEGRPKTAVQLAVPTNASVTLINRIARRLVTMQMIDQTAPEVYAPNHLTYVLTAPEYSGGISFLHDCAGPSFQHLPEYLRITHYANPSSLDGGPFQFALKEPHGTIWMKGRPDLRPACNAYMHSQSRDGSIWWRKGGYPVQERLSADAQLGHDNSTIVDVGGGDGHVMNIFSDEFPAFGGRLIVQDLPHVIDQVRKQHSHSQVELQAHDFFTMQPIKQARAYYLRRILHNWPDDRCRTILGHLKDVMEPGYSRILIDEFIIADQDPHWLSTSLDLLMMAMCSSHERTEKEWRELLGSVGLRLTGIWSMGLGKNSLIEAML